MVDGCIFTGSILAIVATVTASCYTLVIKHASGKTGGDMAARTIFCGGNMIHRFASGRCTIMAGSAVIHDTGMIEHRVEKTTGDVTDTAILRSG